MRCRPILLACALLASPVAASTDANTFCWFSIKGVAAFQPLRARLQRLVDANATQKVNTICVIGQRPSGQHRAAYVYWPTMNKLILWEPSSDDPDDIAHSRRYLDLTSDVVADDDVGGSTYLVTRQWTRLLIAACRAHGETLTIVKSGRHGG